MKLTLLHKGLLLVSIPLCFEITIFGVLLHMQDQLEHEAERIALKKQISEGINGLVHNVIGIVDTFEVGSGSHIPDSQPTIFARIIEIRRDISGTLERFRKIRVLAQEDPVVLEKLNKCGNGMLLAKNDLIELAHKLNNARAENISPMLLAYRKKLSKDLHESLANGLLELSETTTRDTEEVTSPKLRENMRILLKFALAFSVLFALLGAALFSKQMAARLALVGENADKLAKGEPLLEPIGGTDEVAELDNHLHYAANLLDEAKRMRQEVTAMITHDLKTPLQSVRSYLEMLDAGLLGELNGQGKRLLATTESASQHMVGLIDSVLQLEKMRTGNIQLQISLVEIAPLLEKCLQSVDALAEGKHITLARDFTTEHCDVSGDAFWLQEVFVNLMSNAIKYSPQNTTVSITTRVVEKNVEIAVEDQGPGISENEIKLIFQRFHRVQATADVSGTGLGLPIAKQLVEMHKGSIKVESADSKGSTFIVTLPIWLPGR
jgi:signal transduction histidine kinase